MPECRRAERACPWPGSCLWATGWRVPRDQASLAPCGRGCVQTNFPQAELPRLASAGPRAFPSNPLDSQSLSGDKWAAETKIQIPPEQDCRLTEDHDPERDSTSIKTGNKAGSGISPWITASALDKAHLSGVPDERGPSGRPVLEFQPTPSWSPDPNSHHQEIG